MPVEMQPPPRIVDEADVEWVAHPRFTGIAIKQLLSSAENPQASISRVRVPPGGTIGWHEHEGRVETVFVISGRSRLTLAGQDHDFGSGQIVAIPAGVQHTLVNLGTETVELLCIFTPPLAS